MLIPLLNDPEEVHSCTYNMLYNIIDTTMRKSMQLNIHYCLGQSSLHKDCALFYVALVYTFLGKKLQMQIHIQ